MNLKWNLCICVWEKKKDNSFENNVIILSYTKNVNFLFKRILKLQNILPKHPFFFTLETVLKMAKETSKGDVENIFPKVTKHIKKVVKAEFDLNYL